MTTQPPHKGALVAVIDDDNAARDSIGQMLRLRGYRLELFPSGESALTWPRLPEADCVVTDVRMPGMSGEEFLAEVLRRRLPCPVVMITGHGDIPMAVRCLKAGAYDFIEKPFEDDLLLACVARAVEKSALRREGESLRKRLELMTPDEDGRYGMVGASPVMQDLYAQIEVAARGDTSILIAGETGAGKELVARAIHGLSPRKDGPFVPVNAAALPDTLLESELFGHARGAFTGAEAERDGKIVSASGGTLLLDEIEGIPLRAQVQLLRVLEDGLVQPLGKDTLRAADVRILATTKTDLMGQVKSGQMREDFYHRIVVLTINVPPLRERSDDIPLLIAHFMQRVCDRYATQRPEIPDDTLLKMTRYSWPGNVRELRNTVERMVITAHHGVVGQFELDDEGGSRLLSLPAASGRLHDEMERTERTVIEVALRENRGEVGATSTALGISRRALYERMKKYGLSKEGFRG